MFCRFCGKKMNKPEQPCPCCGKGQGILRVTNGYFGILDNTLHPENARVLTGEISNNKKSVEKKGTNKEDDRREDVTKEPSRSGKEINAASLLLWLKNRKQYMDKKSLGIMAAVVLLFFSLICMIYQNHKISELNRKISDLESQRMEHQEPAGNENEGKKDSYGE